MVRQGVTTSSPEGAGWLHIPTPERGEVSRASVTIITRIIIIINITITVSGH